MNPTPPPSPPPTPPPFDRWEMIVLFAVIFIIVILAGWATSYARRREKDKS